MNSDQAARTFVRALWLSLTVLVTVLGWSCVSWSCRSGILVRCPLSREAATKHLVECGEALVRVRHGSKWCYP